LVVYVIEGYTGRIIHHFFERGVLFNQPIHLLINENSVIVSFVRDTKSQIGQQTIQVVEFYQQQSTMEKETFPLLVGISSGKASMKQRIGESPKMIS